MLSAFVITLREGMEAALAVGIMLAYLRKSGRGALRSFVWIGLAVGVVASAAAIWGLDWARGFGTFNEEAYEGVVLLVAAVLIATLLVWMARAARGLKHEIEGAPLDVTQLHGSAIVGRIRDEPIRRFHLHLEPVLAIVRAHPDRADCESSVGHDAPVNRVVENQIGVERRRGDEVV